MHALHPKNLFALVCLLLLTASAALATPANHDALMTDGAYKKAFEAYSTTEREAGKRLDARDFAAVRKAVQTEVEKLAKTGIADGSPAAEAWSSAYEQGRDSLKCEMEWDWLRRHPEGIQGLYRMQSKAFDGWMTVRKEKQGDMYTVHIVASQKSAPFNSGELTGTGKITGNAMDVADSSDENNPIHIAFDGDMATITEPKSFKESGLLGAGVSFDGDFKREKKSSGKKFSKEELKRLSLFLSNFTELSMFNFTARDVLNTAKPYDMIRFGIWHNFINNSKRVKPCATNGCKWGSLTIACPYVQNTIQKYFGYDLKQCLSAKNPESNSSTDNFHFDGKIYHFEGADGEAVYYARVDEATQGADGLIEMKGVVYNADDKDDILGNFTAFAKANSGKNPYAIVSLKTQIKE